MNVSAAKPVYSKNATTTASGTLPNERREASSPKVINKVDTLSLAPETDPILQLAKNDTALKQYLDEIQRRKPNANSQSNPLLMEADKTKYTKELVIDKQIELVQRTEKYLTEFQKIYEQSKENKFMARSVTKLIYLSQEIAKIDLTKGDSQELGYQLTLLDRTLSSIVNDYKESKEIAKRGGSVSDFDNEVKNVTNSKNIYQEPLIEGTNVFYSDLEKDTQPEMAASRKEKIQKALKSFQGIDPLKLLNAEALKNGKQKIIIAVDINEKLLDPGFRAVNAPIDEAGVQSSGIYLGKSFFNGAASPEAMIPVIGNELFDAHGRYLMNSGSSIYSGAFISSKEYQCLGMLYSFMLSNHQKPYYTQESFVKAFCENLPSYYSADLRYNPDEFNFSAEQKAEFSKLTKQLTNGLITSFDDLYNASKKYFHQAT